MPSTARNDIWNPTSQRLNGFIANCTTAAKASVFSDTCRRPVKTTNAKMVSIVAERNTLGGIPTRVA
jgi:hypothetical protein